jgi:hypothetical protein
VVAAIKNSILGGIAAAQQDKLLGMMVAIHGCNHGIFN